MDGVTAKDDNLTEKWIMGSDNSQNLKFTFHDNVNTSYSINV